MRSTLRITWPYLWRYRRGLGWGFGALLLKDLTAAALPLTIKAGIDSLTEGFHLRAVFWFAALLVGISAIKGFFQYWMRVIIISISRDIEYDLRNDLFRHLTRLSSGFYSRHRTGDIMARATNDLNAVRMMFGPGIMYWTETSLTFGMALIVMLAIDWRLTLMALSPAPLVSIAVVFFGRRIHDRFEVIQGLFSDISSRVQENLAGVRVIRAYVQEDSELRTFEVLNRDYIDQNIRLVRLSGVFMPLLQALIGLTFLILLWVGGLRLMRGELTLGTFVMFNTYLSMLIWPMIAFGWVVNLMQRGNASLKRIAEFMGEVPEIASPASPTPLPSPFQGRIEFRSVAVRYDGTSALSGIDLTIPAGATVAVVGHTGSGKTSLVRLVSRLMDPSEGAVLLDGVDAREFSPADVRSVIGMVPQETFLFSATLAENIAFGVKEATEEQIRHAA
ncbi:MAG: ABC transporter transmembrane domain-containing protein, partial [Bryobacterales bacterium]|nr:ABC transporter transmembrane domain-containing protein [Bryobacterales bacterium]